jgi:hypothetical protein
LFDRPTSVTSPITTPDVTLPSPARQCIKVDLPEPDGPMMAVSSPRSQVNRHMVERPHFGRARTETLDDVDRSGSGWSGQDGLFCSAELGHGDNNGEARSRALLGLPLRSTLMSVSGGGSLRDRR